MPHEEEAALAIYKISVPDSTIDPMWAMPIRLLRRLALPRLRPWQSITSISCHSAPTSLSYSRTTSYTSTGVLPRFQHNPDYTIIGLNIQIGDQHVAHAAFRSYHILVHRRALLTLVDLDISESNSVVPAPEPANSAWQEWGTKTTRWFTTPQLGSAQCKLSGQRLLPCYSPRINPSLLRIFDFNPYTARKLYFDMGDTPQILPNGTIRRAVVAKSVIPATENVFEEDVESELPYCEVRTTEPGYQQAWMDGEMIMCSKVCGRYIVVSERELAR